ncbi:hypothetical protein GCM10010964_28820 [Caldovatus sediminis]|uniref:Uncharacterized protein n=1 Tax=Caldovatus sediminis TaxID=2041189 RepID=A0A8J3ED42_9PROT|nr:DUF6441 family protein [Caldovatus sediminis]GGG39497.1 hypothetical protein GCM10010964_28820 [Caldovatus sediminis]
MRLAATILGDLRQVLAAEVRAGERAAMQAIRAETEQVKQELRQQVTSSFGGNARGIANAWRSQVFPRSGQSLRPAGLVWTKVPNVIDAFERGALIRARSGTYLAIPTGFNAARGRRGRGEKGLRVTPAQMVASGQGFLRPFRSGRGFVWCLPLRSGSHRGDAAMGSRQGEQTGRRRRIRLIAGGLAEIGTGNRKGREAWAREMLARGMVPMFLLLPQVKLAKRLDVKGAAERGLRRLPERFVAAWERESGRQAP